MLAGALIGGASTFTRGAFDLFLVSTAVVLLFGHSLGSHRRLVHDSFQ
jgi:sn-1 stearoyl-lipid 9-desaturase